MPDTIGRLDHPTRVSLAADLSSSMRWATGGMVMKVVILHAGRS